jgi:hypothetical protein
MKYKTWYFRYTQEITEEIYNKIVIRLASWGFEQYCHFSLAMEYQDFLRHGFIRNDSDRSGWCIDNNPQDCKKEIFLEDFLIEEITTYEIY